MIDLDTLFRALTLFMLLPWALLLVLPRWQGTQLLVHSVAMPVALGLLYTYFFATGAFFGGSLPEGAGFGSLDGVMVFFTSPEAVLAGWIHYLVFDLFIGAWIVRDAGARGVPHLAVVPILPI